MQLCQRRLRHHQLAKQGQGALGIQQAALRKEESERKLAADAQQSILGGVGSLCRQSRQLALRPGMTARTMQQRRQHLPVGLGRELQSQLLNMLFTIGSCQQLLLEQRMAKLAPAAGRQPILPGRHQRLHQPPLLPKA